MEDQQLKRLRDETPGLREGVHLLAAGSALMPQPVVDAIVDHTLLEARVGGYRAYNLQRDFLDGVYDTVAQHIGASPREIAVVENATAAWCQAFYALPLKRGARILTCQAEYAANYVALLQRAAQDDLSIEVVPDDAHGVLDTVALESMVDHRVGLIAITWIPTNGGMVNPAAAVGAIARRHNIPYLLDACQAVGQMPVDVASLGCDFLSATGRKFLRGPRGTGFLYVAARWLDSLEPVMIDHFAAPWVSRDAYQLRDDARRFETWENAYALRAGLHAAVAYASDIGMEAIRDRSWALARSCRAAISALPGARVRDKGQPKQQGAIVSFTIDGADPAEIVALLQEKGFTIGVTSPSSTRLDAEARELPDMLRVAPHYYNTEDEIADFVSALRGVIEA